MKAQLIETETPSSSAVEAGAGFTNGGYLLYGSYARYFHNGSKRHPHSPLRTIPCPGEKRDVFLFPGRFYGKATLFYNTGLTGALRYSSVGVDAALCYTMVRIKESFFINVKGGLTLSSDRLTNAVNHEQSSEEAVRFGPLIGAEAEWFFTSKLALVFGGDQRFFLKKETSWVNHRGFGYGGIRLNL